MPTPRITGLLNNCALNSALPTLLDGIRQLAEHEAAGTLSTIANNVIVQSYNSLKKMYANHYGVGTNPAFDWREFHAFISKHSFYANEMMFAPILRNFIAEVGLKNGYARDDIWMLRDIQEEDGRYNNLHYLEAVKLFHNQFGISLRTYEYVANKGTENPRDNYNLIDSRLTTNPIYPFGDTPIIDLYLKGDHFEIQPHENLAQANREFDGEVNTLPGALAGIHEALSFSYSAHSSNEQLGQLVVYGHQSLMEHFAASAQLKLAVAASLAGMPPKSPVINKTTDGYKAYLIDAKDYAISGSEFHSDTPEGRHTFAVILLTLLVESNIKGAQSTLDQLDTLAFAANSNKPLASYLLNKLATAIIESKADLKVGRVTEVLEEIERNHRANSIMRSIEQTNHDQHRVDLVQKAKQTIKQAWQLYKETDDETLITVIKKTQAVVLEPSQKNFEEYDVLREQVNGRGSWGKMIAGLMLSVLGLALVVGAALCLVGTLGFAAPVSIPSIAVGGGMLVTGVGSLVAGLGLFNSSKDSGLYLQMKEFSEEVVENIAIQG